MKITRTTDDPGWVHEAIGRHDQEGGREPGLHLYDVLHDLCATLDPDRFSRKNKDETDQSFKLRIAIGLAYEQHLGQALALMAPGRFVRPPSAQCDGIWCSADEIDLDDESGQMRVGELKATWLSARHEIDDPKLWHWLTQLKCYCVHPRTRILTDDLRWVPAHTLRVGDPLLAFDEQTGLKGRLWRRAWVTAVTPIVRPCYELVLDDGTEVVCSEDHQWLTLPSQSVTAPVWTRTDRLLGTDSPRFGTKQPHRICKPINTWAAPTDYQSGWVGGFMDGEGCVCQSQNGSIQLGASQKPGPVADRFRRALREAGIATGTSPHQGVVSMWITGGQAKQMECLGRFRPERLLKKWQTFDQLPEATMGKRAVGVARRRFLGDQLVWAIETTTGTYVAEGLASHNCHVWGTVLGRLRVLYVAGDYSYPIRPSWVEYDIEFAPHEPSEAWQMIKAHGRARGMLK